MSSFRNLISTFQRPFLCFWLLETYSKSYTSIRSKKDPGHDLCLSPTNVFLSSIYDFNTTAQPPYYTLSISNCTQGQAPQSPHLSLFFLKDGTYYFGMERRRTTLVNSKKRKRKLSQSPDMDIWKLILSREGIKELTLDNAYVQPYNFPHIFLAQSSLIYSSVTV